MMNHAACALTKDWNTDRNPGRREFTRRGRPRNSLSLSDRARSGLAKDGKLARQTRGYARTGHKGWLLPGRPMPFFAGDSSEEFKLQIAGFARRQVMERRAEILRQMPRKLGILRGHVLPYGVRLVPVEQQDPAIRRGRSGRRRMTAEKEQATRPALGGRIDLVERGPRRKSRRTDPGRNLRPVRSIWRKACAPRPKRFRPTPAS